MSQPPYVPLVHLTRRAQDRDMLEGVQLGALALVDGEGALLGALGDAALPVVLRSTAKPFQLLPFLCERLDEGLEDDDLAVMMSSHSGEPRHTARVARLLARAGLEERHLGCGTHPPFHAPTRDALLRAGQPWTALHCNCSGKHAAMLSVCKAAGWPLDTYLAPKHPLQNWILSLLWGLSGVPWEEIPVGVDGCAAPTFELPLVALARLYARERAVPPPYGHSMSRLGPLLERLAQAAMAAPAMIGGEDRLDTGLMESAPGRVVAKTGAMGVYAAAVRPCARFPKGLGVALKVIDGDPTSQARAVVMTALLEQLGALPDERAWSPCLRRAAERRVLNNLGQEVGAAHPAFPAWPWA
jgi:L-asparaginase II